MTWAWLRYDALGRMVARETLDSSAVTIDEEVYYYQGFNCLATEYYAGGSADTLAVVRPAGEAASTPAGEGWGKYVSISSYYGMAWADASARRRTARLYYTASSTSWQAAKFLIGDRYGSNYNANDEPIEAARRVVSFWMKNDFDYTGTRYVGVTSGARATNGSTYSLHWYLDDTGWQYHELDAEAALAAAVPTAMLSTIDYVLFYCNDIQIDDLTIGNGRMKASYQTIPGAALGGVLGCQAGEDFDADGETQWYYHYNELGTVVATTGDDGAQLGVYMPDYFGNYRTVVGARPDTMGLTGKFYDEDLGLYYYDERWYDPVRGVFVSVSPLGRRAEREYEYCHSMPNYFTDVHGLYPGYGFGPNNPYGSSATEPLPIDPCTSAKFNMGVAGKGLAHPWEHCMWNCRMVFECGADHVSAIMMSFYKEMWDTLGALTLYEGASYSAFQKNDFEDNATGRKCGQKIVDDGCSTCESCCRAHGITPDMPDRAPGPLYSENSPYWGKL